MPTHLARHHTLTRSGRQWRCETCDKHASDGAAKAKNWHALDAWDILQRRWGSRQGPNVTSWLRRAASCGAAGAEREQPSLQRSLASRAWEQPRSQENARSICLLSSGWHPTEKTFSGITEAVHRASVDEVTAKVPRRQLRQSWAGRSQASSGSASYGRIAQPTGPLAGVVFS